MQGGCDGGRGSDDVSSRWPIQTHSFATPASNNTHKRFTGTFQRGEALRVSSMYHSFIRLKIKSRRACTAAIARSIDMAERWQMAWMKDSIQKEYSQVTSNAAAHAVFSYINSNQRKEREEKIKYVRGSKSRRAMAISYAWRCHSAFSSPARASDKKTTYNSSSESNAANNGNSHQSFFGHLIVDQLSQARGLEVRGLVVK